MDYAPIYLAESPNEGYTRPIPTQSRKHFADVSRQPTYSTTTDKMKHSWMTLSVIMSPLEA